MMAIGPATHLPDASTDGRLLTLKGPPRMCQMQTGPAPCCERCTRGSEQNRYRRTPLELPQRHLDAGRVLDLRPPGDSGTETRCRPLGPLRLGRHPADRRHETGSAYRAPGGRRVGHHRWCSLVLPQSQAGPARADVIGVSKTWRTI